MSFLFVFYASTICGIKKKHILRTVTKILQTQVFPSWNSLGFMTILKKKKHIWITRGNKSYLGSRFHTASKWQETEYLIISLPRY